MKFNFLVSPATQKTADNIEAKAADYDRKMPSMKDIHEMLNELKVPHYFGESVNVIEKRTAGKKYVDSRRNGKKGFRLCIKDKKIVDGAKITSHMVELDSSESYYSANSYFYAKDIYKIIKYVAEHKPYSSI